MRRTNEAIVAVLRGRRLLVLHRRPDAYWHLVAGGVEAGETPEQAARRELLEETGLDAVVRPDGWSFVYDGITVDVFSAEAPTGWEPVLNDEHDDYRWCELDEALRLLRWPEPRALAARLLR